MNGPIWCTKLESQTFDPFVWISSISGNNAFKFSWKLYAYKNYRATLYLLLPQYIKLAISISPWNKNNWQIEESKKGRPLSEIEILETIKDDIFFNNCRICIEVKSNKKKYLQKKMHFIKQTRYGILLPKWFLWSRKFLKYQAGSCIQIFTVLLKQKMNILYTEIHMPIQHKFGHIAFY